MLAPQYQLWRPIPDSHHDLVTSEQPSLRQRLVPQSRQPQISNLDDSGRGDEDIGGFQVSMEDEVGVQEVDADK